MARLWQQIVCVRLSLTGEHDTDLRYPPANAGRLGGPGFLPGETEMWAEVWRRREPDRALFINGLLVYKGAFASSSDAYAKFALIDKTKVLP